MLLEEVSLLLALFILLRLEGGSGDLEITLLFFDFKEALVSITIPLDLVREVILLYIDVTSTPLLVYLFILLLIVLTYTTRNITDILIALVPSIFSNIA